MISSLICNIIALPEPTLVSCTALVSAASCQLLLTMLLEYGLQLLTGTYCSERAGGELD